MCWRETKRVVVDIGRPPDSWVTQLSTARYGHRQSKPPPSADTTHRPTDRWTVPLYNLPATTRNVKTGSFQNQMKDLVETLPLLLSMDFKFAITILRVAIACSFSTLKMETAFFSETCVKLHQNTEGGGFNFVRSPNLALFVFYLKNIKCDFPTSATVITAACWDVKLYSLVDD